MTDIDRILKFWFADGTAQDKLWFGKDAQIDQTIRTEFGSLFDDPEVSNWTSQPGGRLAAIVLYDQLTRNAFRDTAKMFAYDAKALVLARGADTQPQSLYEAVFQLLPFEHSENLADQDHCVAALREVERRAPVELRDKARGYVDYALRHRVIIERFGRFPHRNQILGRPSTAEEIEFLKQPGSGF